MRNGRQAKIKIIISTSKTKQLKIPLVILIAMYPILSIFWRLESSRRMMAQRSHWRGTGDDQAKMNNSLWHGGGRHASCVNVSVLLILWKIIYEMKITTSTYQRRKVKKSADLCSMNVKKHVRLVHHLRRRRHIRS